MADKKLFGQADDNNPPLTDKIAFGTDTNNARNMTFTNLLSWLEGKLGFFRTANNLSEGNAAEIRYNIGTYSKAEIDNKDFAKADKKDVLHKNNTTSYTPIGDYNPATVKFVNDSHKKSKCLQSTSGLIHSLGSLLDTAEYPPANTFILKFTGSTQNSVTLPSDSVLTQAFGYTEGVILFITCSPQSTQAGKIGGQLLNGGAGQIDHVMKKGDSVMVQRIPSFNDRNWQLINYFQ